MVAHAGIGGARAGRAGDLTLTGSARDVAIEDVHLRALRDPSRLELDPEEGLPAIARVLGWPTLIQGDVLLELINLHERAWDAARVAYAEWSLLLETGLDGGRLYVALPTADLLAGRFDRAQATVVPD